MKENVVVLGSGVGGLSSALYLARGGYSPLVIEGDLPGGQLTYTDAIENWPGEVSISGNDLVEKIKQQVIKSGAHFFSGRVIQVDLSKRPFTFVVQTNKGQTVTIESNYSIIALGTHPRFLGIDGEKTFYGKGVSHCALCDGSLYQDQTVAVIGGSEAALTEARYLSQIAKKVYLIYRGKEIKTRESQREKELLEKGNITFLPETVVKKIQGDQGEVQGLYIHQKQLGKEDFLSVDGIFLALGSAPNTDLFKDQLVLNQDQSILLTKGQKTSVDGVYAVGDITSKIKQAVIAAGDGAKAAIEMMEVMEKDGVKKSVLQPKQLDVKAIEQGAIEITSLDHFQNELDQAKGPVLVDFYATWCGPCKRIAPYIDQLAKNFSGRIKILKVNVDNHRSLLKTYGIKSMPTLVLFDKDHKNILTRKVGTDEIMDLLSNDENLISLCQDFFVEGQ